MASENKENPINFGGDENILLVRQCLEDFGIPAQKAYSMVNIYYSCYDYMADVQKFKENYDSFKEIHKISEIIQQKQNLVEDRVKALTDEIMQKESWFQSYRYCRINENKMNAAEQCTEEMKKEANKFKDVFKSKEATQSAADEVLNRANVMRVIQLLLVFKDVVIGAHKVIKTARDIRDYNEDFNDIYKEYVQPTINQFNKNGTIDVDLVKRGIWMLKQLRKKVIKSQVDTQQSIVTHGLNTVTMGLSAYATFNNISTLQGIASKAALTFNWFIGASQATLAVGSLMLTGIESYNYIQYKSLIEKIEQEINILEDYQKYQQKSK